MAIWDNGTTNIRGAAFGNPTRDELAAVNARQPGQNLVRSAAPVAPDATRGEGTLTKYRPIGGWQDQGRGANLVANAAEMGEPASFRGGAGAPAPAEVIRGGRLTYTNPAAATPGGGYNPAPGTGTAEFATPTEAGQAWNRGQRGAFLAANPVNPNLTYPPGSSPEEQASARFGGYRTPGQTGQEIAATKEGPGQTQERTMKGQLFEQATQEKREAMKKEQSKIAVEDFNKLLHESPYSTFDATKGQLAFKPKDENMARDAKAAESIAHQSQDPQAGLQHFNERQMVRQWLLTQPLQPNTNINAMLDAASTNPDHWQGLVSDARKVMGVSRPATAPAGVPPGSLMAAGEAPFTPLAGSAPAPVRQPFAM